MKKTVLIVFVILIGLAVGYYFGYDHGWERAVDNPTEESRIQDTGQEIEKIDYHASFLIFTNGIKRSFTAAMYHNLSEDVYIETANPAIVHVTRPKTTWGDFFETLPMQVTYQCFVTGSGEKFCNIDSKTLKFFINGQKIDGFLDEEIRDDDWILISYGKDDEKEIAKQLDQASKILSK
ncbi:MAG: hypothetical protein Q8R55_00250 [Candidatus Taylorbacteria bacterium]|nr:hypothetical protein [Candidatus Taylorbacteria bacterium]